MFSRSSRQNHRSVRGPSTSADEDAADGADGEPSTGQPVRLPEVFIGGEGLVRGAADVLGTLLHEAAHALAHVRDIKDTSRQGRWHNAKFKALAEELGIEVAKDPRIGWSPTAIPASTREEYAEVIDELGRVLRLHRARRPRRVRPAPAAIVGGDDRAWVHSEASRSAGTIAISVESFVVRNCGDLC